MEQTSVCQGNDSDFDLATDASSPGDALSPLALTFATCTLCGIDDSTPVAVGEDFEYRTSPDEFLAVRCRTCGLVYLNPRPSDEEAGRIYPSDYHAFAFKPAEFGVVYRVRRWLEARRLLRWCRGLPAGARILDVGCGDGFHLRLLREYGKQSWKLEGIDVDSRAVAAAQSQELTIHQGALEGVDLAPESYDLVLLIMTIEHLSHPAETLRSVARLLAPGGRVVIVTDNTGSPDFALFGGRHWGGYHFPRHTYLFNRATLRRLAATAGMEVELVSTAVSPVNWTYSLRNFLDDWGGPRWMVNMLSLKSVLALTVFTLLDMPLALFGYGAILQAVFRRPAVVGRSE
ncbi:MAG: class I SAM-dependent methyltransferase [Pirellulaceae bacterium]